MVMIVCTERKPVKNGNGKNGKNGKSWLKQMKSLSSNGDMKKGLVKKILRLSIENKELIGRIKRDYHDIIRVLANIIDASDPYTHGHSGRVMKYTMAICKKLGISGKDRKIVKNASLLHDIGKVFIPRSVLNKKVKLSKTEWKKVQVHPATGAKIILQLSFLYNIAPIIFHHHAKFGGGGYPDSKKKGCNIPIGARIIAVCDAFDAMTSERPYRSPYPERYAIRELKRCSGDQFDPQVVGAFVDYYKKMI